MRLGRRRSWVQISEALRDEGVDVAPVTIYNFLKRYARRARAGTLPLGFAPIDPQPPEPTRQPGPCPAPAPVFQTRNGTTKETAAQNLGLLKSINVQIRYSFANH